MQRDTAPSPITRIRPSNAVTCHPLVRFPRLSHPLRNWYRRGVERDLAGVPDGLSLDRETMRELGYRTVDMLVERLLDDTVPPLRRATPAEMRARLSGPPPGEPQPFDELLRRLGEDVLPFTSRGEHPALPAFVPFAGTWPGALGDFIASACNIYAGSWMEAAGPTQLELQVLEWFRGWIGLPDTRGRDAAQRRLGGEHDGARRCARVRRRRDE